MHFEPCFSTHTTSKIASIQYWMHIAQFIVVAVELCWQGFSIFYSTNRSSSPNVAYIYVKKWECIRVAVDQTSTNICVMLFNLAFIPSFLRNMVWNLVLSPFHLILLWHHLFSAACIVPFSFSSLFLCVLICDSLPSIWKFYFLTTYSFFLCIKVQCFRFLHTQLFSSLFHCTEKHSSKNVTE